MFFVKRIRFLVLVLVCFLMLEAGVEAKSRKVEFKIADLNIWHDKGDWPARFGVMAEKFRELDPDVICLQEVLQHDELENQARALSVVLGYEYFFASVDPEIAPKRYGNAILSKYPILDSSMKVLKPRRQYRVAAYILVEKEGIPINVYTTHLHHGPGDSGIRSEQVRDFLEFLKKSRKDGPVFLTGDFNAGYETPELIMLQHYFLDAAYEKHGFKVADTYTTENPYIKRVEPGYTRIDYIWYIPTREPRVKVKELDVIFNEPNQDGVFASDHYGLFGVFEIKKKIETKKSKE